VAGGRGPTGRFSTHRYLLRDFRKKAGPRAPRPPGGGAEGPPSTRNWPFRWALPPVIPPQVVPKAMRAASWPGRRFWGAELHQRRHSRAAGVPALLPFEWLSKTRGAQAVAPQGLAGLAELGPLFQGGGRRSKAVAFYAPFLVFKGIAAYKRRNARPKRKCAVLGTSWRSCFEPSSLDYLRSIQDLGGS
jgi:hypothetical protein